METTTLAYLDLRPQSQQHDALRAYAQRYAEAANWLVEKVLESGISDNVRLHRLFYGRLRDRFDLPSQSAVLCIRHVARLCRHAVEPPEVSWTGPIPFDRHLFSLKSVDQLSLATLAGRVVVACAVASYSLGKLTVSSGELSFSEGRWIFSMRTSLSQVATQHPTFGKESIMSDKLLTRVTRLISGLAHNALSNAEGAAAVPVMEQAIRDIDEAIKDVRVEIGQNEATKFNATRRVTELQNEHEGLNEKIAVALNEGREELAETGVGRQLDIENQVALLQRTVADVEQDIAKLSDSINALQASRREAQHRIRDLKTSVPASDSFGAAGPKGSATSKAADAIEAAQRLGEDLTGVPSETSQISHKDLDDLAELHRQNSIRERLAKHRASLKSEE